MTPKKEAIELVAKFSKLIEYEDCEMETMETDALLAIQCALITANKVLNVLFQHHEIDYWKQVKKEIEQLP